MTKRELDFLERVFSEEISGKPLQSKSKIAKKLEKEGYVQEIQMSIPCALGEIISKGYVLTIKGNYTYCKNCDTLFSL